MKNREKIWTGVELRIGDVVLNISTKNSLTQRTDALENFGYIEIDSGHIGESALFWDNITFFINCDYETFKEECGSELHLKGLKTKENFKIIKRLINKAIELNVISAT